MTSFRQSVPEGRSDLPAELTLRFGAERWPGRVCWPAAISAPFLIFLLDDAGDDAFSTSLCSAAAAVVLSMPTRPSASESIELAALGWAAEHASDLGATPRLLLAGVYVGGGHAARLAVAARDLGWPPLHRQLLVHPMFDAVCPIPSEVAGIAPATIVTAAPGDERLTGYAARLHAAGVDVDEIQVPNRVVPRGAELDELVPSLFLGLSGKPTTQQRSYQA